MLEKSPILTAMRPLPRLLIVGNLTEDVGEFGSRIGGASAYAGLLASRFGVPASILTAVDAGFPFEPEGCRVLRLPSPTRTRFENRYEEGTRHQRLLGAAAPIPESRVREAVRGLPERAGVLYAPVASELDGEWTLPRPVAGPVGVLPQGFLRAAREDGRVRVRWPPELPGRLLDMDLVSLSRAEQPPFPFAPPLLAVTDGKRGATLFRRGENALRIPAIPAAERDPTGAGDVFGAALFLELASGHSLRDAGRVAAAAAALTVEAAGVSGIPDRTAALARLAC